MQKAIEVHHKERKLLEIAKRLAKAKQTRK